MLGCQRQSHPGWSQCSPALTDGCFLVIRTEISPRPGLSRCFCHLFRAVPVWPRAGPPGKGDQNQGLLFTFLTRTAAILALLGCHVCPTLQQHSWEAQGCCGDQDMSPVPPLSSWLPRPGSAQPQPWICQADLLLALLLSGLSPLPFPHSLHPSLIVLIQSHPITCLHLQKHLISDSIWVWLDVDRTYQL